MGDLPYISSEQGGGLIIGTELIYELPYTPSQRTIATYRKNSADAPFLLVPRLIINPFGVWE